MEKKPDPVIEAALKWWKNLENNTGERARLRRCSSLEEVMFQPAYVHLATKLGYFRVYHKNIAAIAGILAHVRSNQSGKSMGEAFAGSGKVVLSELRMRKLLASDNIEDAFRNLIRAIKLLNNNVPIADLVQSLRYWNQQTRKKWAYDYYSNAKDEL